MGNKVVHFEILGADGKRTQDFYSKLFGWNVDANNPMAYGMVDAGSAGIGGGLAQAQGNAMLTVYVEVSDLAATLKKAEELGAKTVMPPMDVPGGPSIAQFQDADGNVVGILKAGSMGG